MQNITPYSNIQTLIETLQAGKFIILVDDEERENEGDLILPAQFTTPEKINFLIKEARGLVCLPIKPSLAQRLELTPMVRDQDNRSANQTKFTVSVEAATGITTGISAYDRATTILCFANPQVKTSDFVSPGHIFPIVSHPDGLQAREGHTEASLELMELAGLTPVAVICEIISASGRMATREELFQFSKHFDVPIGTIRRLLQYSRKKE